MADAKRNLGATPRQQKIKLKKKEMENKNSSVGSKKNKNVGVQLWWRSLALFDGGLRQGHAKKWDRGREGVGGLALLAKLVLSVGRAHLVLPVSCLKGKMLRKKKQSGRENNSERRERNTSTHEEKRGSEDVLVGEVLGHEGLVLACHLLAEAVEVLHLLAVLRSVASHIVLGG